jgi:hypothetical protein
MIAEKFQFCGRFGPLDGEGTMKRSKFTEAQIAFTLAPCLFLSKCAENGQKLVKLRIARALRFL